MPPDRGRPSTRTFPISHRVNRAPHAVGIAGTVAVLLAGPTPAWAGMPRVTAVLTEVAAQRVEVISFFLVVLLLAAAGVRWLWNGLTADFPDFHGSATGGRSGWSSSGGRRSSWSWR